MAVRISKDMAKKLGIVIAKSNPANRGMNRWEGEWADKLETARLCGECIWWGWEAIKFRLADKTWYTPDFFVLWVNDAEPITVYEVKGFKRDDGLVKLKVAAEMYPFAFRMVEKKRGEWKETVIPGKRT